MSSSGTFRQDMPPPGGYARIPFERIPARKVLGPKTVIGLVSGASLFGFYMWSRNFILTTRFETEMRSARLALHPMLHAEKDRAYLQQLRKNRDEEERLMANVPGWVVGTWYGEPIYKSLGADEWRDVVSGELYAHSDPWYYRHNFSYHKWA